MKIIHYSLLLSWLLIVGIASPSNGFDDKIDLSPTEILSRAGAGILAGLFFGLLLKSKSGNEHTVK